MLKKVQARNNTAEDGGLPLEKGADGKQAKGCDGNGVQQHSACLQRRLLPSFVDALRIIRGSTSAVLHRAERAMLQHSRALLLKCE